MSLGKKLITIIVCLHFVVSFAYAKKSVFIISNHQSSYAQAYSIEGTQIVYQADIDISSQNPGFGAVGNAVWPEKNLMFITYESSGKIVWSSTKTLDKVGEFETGNGNLAGIVIDRGRGYIYVMSDGFSELYVYSFDEIDNTLVLEGIYYLNPAPPYYYVYGVGLALDENRNLLYVTSAYYYSYNRVHIYDTNDFIGSGGDVDPNGFIDIVVDGTSRAPIGIAVDPVRRYMYTGSWGIHDYLVRTQIDPPYTSTEVLVENESYSGSATGLGVDEDSGLVYCTTTLNDFRVYDSNLILKDTETNNISGPAGVAVGGWYKKPLFSLVKDNNDPNNGCVDPNKYKNLTFDIFWDVNGHPDTNKVVIDQLPDELDYNSLSSPTGDYNSFDRIVKWNISGNSGHIVLKTNVNKWAKPYGTITNTAIMEGDTYLTKDDCNVDVCPWGTQIIYVDRDATQGFNNGTDWNDAYLDLQDALTQARNSPEMTTPIWVAAGPYKPVNNVNIFDYKSKSFELPDNVALIGHFGGIGTYETSPYQRNFNDANNETILEGKIGQNDGDSVYRVVTGTGIENVLIDGFTVEGSRTVYPFTVPAAGIDLNAVSDISIVNCKIRDNHYYGIYVENYSYPNIYNCTFTSNNIAGIYIYDHSELEEISSCIFDGNGLTGNGILASYYSDVNVEKSIVQNHTEDAININGGGLTLKGSIIRYNGWNGIFLYNNMTTEIINNWIHNNGSSGISFNSQASTPLVRNNTIYQNYAYGIYSSQSGADPNIINCIITGNDTNDLYKPGGSFGEVNYCLLQHSHSGIGNITGDPCFINILGNPDDLHIDVNSICKDAGDPNVSYDDERDIDGEPRVAFGRADIGGDEYYWSKADYNKDANVNFIDFASLARPWGAQDSNISLNTDSDVDIEDLKLFCDDWLWKPAWIQRQWMLDMAFDGGNDMAMASTNSAETGVVQAQTSDALMLTDIRASLAARPARLRARTDKFYDIRPQITVSEIQPAETMILVDQMSTATIAEESMTNDDTTITEPTTIEEIVDWLDAIWQSGELNDVMSEEEYQRFRSDLQESDE
jgi:parallel beta-helix repeat protein